MTALRRIYFLARVEVLHVVRDRATLAQVLVVPIVQLVLLANAATFAIRDTPAYIVDLDRSSVSRGLVQRFSASGRFQLTGQSTSMAVADDSLLRGEATMVLVIPARFEEQLMRARAARVEMSINAEKGAAAGIIQSYAAQILADYSRELSATLRPVVVPRLDAGGVPAPARGMARIDVSARNWFNASLNYKHYMVPGLLVALVTMISTLLSAQNIARERELGTLEQLNATPLTRGQFITAKLLPFWVLGVIDLALGLGVGWLAFDIPIRGSLLLLFGAAGIYLVVTLAIGLWISSLVETQQQAMFITFFVMNIYLLMSGLFTPIASMPDWVQTLSLLNPVRHFVTISRSILVRGAGLAEIATPLLYLCAYAAIGLTLAVRQYSKRAA